ncbi:hypothetical protein D3C72_958750 [compost metagenome]
MHQHIQANLFLKADDFLDFLADGGFVAGIRQRARLPITAQRADFGGLREGTDRGRRVGGQAQLFLLAGDAAGERRTVARHGGRAGHPLAHGRVVNAGRRAAGGQRGALLDQAVLHGRIRRVVQGAAQQA